MIVRLSFIRFGKKNRPLQVSIDNIIAMGAIFHGGLSFPKGVHVDGTVVGPVTAAGADSAVLVGATGRIEGQVVSQTVVIAGTVVGDIRCVHVSVKSGATVNGTIFAASLEIEKGAKIQGSCQSDPDYTPFSVTASMAPALNDDVMDGPRVMNG